jgi:hypothetical protein
MQEPSGRGFKKGFEQGRCNTHWKLSNQPQAGALVVAEYGRQFGGYRGRRPLQKGR